MVDRLFCLSDLPTTFFLLFDFLRVGLMRIEIPLGIGRVCESYELN
jgi:hypothetical protein